MSEMYIIFGVVAMFLLTLMLLLSTQTAIRWFGYGFFIITHWVIAILYIGACWGHWDRLWCWMVASLTLIVIDQLLRALRTCYIHMGGKTGGVGFRAANAKVRVFGQDDDVVIWTSTMSIENPGRRDSISTSAFPASASGNRTLSRHLPFRMGESDSNITLISFGFALVRRVKSLASRVTGFLLYWQVRMETLILGTKPRTFLPWQVVLESHSLCPLHCGP
jgi:hypothetical protein